MNDRKKNLLSVLGIFVLLIAIFGFSYAFFSYLSTGNANTVKLGQIEFTASDKTMQLTNVFPTTLEEAEDVATVSVQGYTTYEHGIDFTIKAVEVVPQNTNIIPTVVVERETVEGITYTDGKSQTTTYDKNNRLTSDTTLCTGHVEGNTRVGSTEELVKLITISAYYDKAEYHISDNTKAELIQYGMLPEGYAGEVISTTDWNALAKDSEGNEVIAYSFKIEVTAVEGEAPTVVKAIKSKVGTDGIVAINTNGELASEGDVIRDYRYSGNARHCTYTYDGQTYSINVDINTCPKACYYSMGGEDLYINRSDNYVVESFGGCSGRDGVEITANELNPLDGDVTNYVWFNDEMWRIIGVFNETSQGTEKELAKIIRDEPLLQEEVPETYTYNNKEMLIKDVERFGTVKHAVAYWNYENYFNQTNSNDWTKASLQYYLNDETIGTNSYYNSIGISYQKMIEAIDYNISNVSEGTNTITLYNDERSGNVDLGNQATWYGKIGLMYSSDFGYADNDNWDISMYDYGVVSGGRKYNNWMHDNVQASNWSISPSSNIDDYDAMCIHSYPSVMECISSSVSNITPVLYLKSDVVITDGDGSYDTPYTLGYNG